MKDTQPGTLTETSADHGLVLTSKQRREVMQEEPLTGSGVPQWVEKRAEQTPGALAIKYGDRCVTYQELNSRANQLAHYLQTKGVGPETLVGVYMQMEPETIIVLLAILKAGGSYLPLDADIPSHRLAFLLHDGGVSVILTQERLQTALPEHNATVVYVERDWPSIAIHGARNLESDFSAAQLAYVIYTSGSTGTPKGVQIEHRGLAHLIEWHNLCFDVKPADRAFAITSFSFDASVWGLWPYLVAGASFHIVPDEETRLVPERLGRWIVAEAITVAFLPTLLAEHMLAVAWPAQTDFRLLLTGGEQLHCYPDLSVPFVLVNNYGPTESTVVATSGVVLPQQTPHRSQLPSIGWPIRNTQIYILDSNLQPVEPGSPGEMYIGSTGLARCYLNNPIQTADGFMPDPFAQQVGARMYQTGDIGLWTPEGEIQFLGRIDSQVKIRGFRVELGEIEAVLQKHPAVRECVVALRQNDTAEEQLIAYLTPQDGWVLQCDEIRAALAESLPDYMIPAHFVELEQLPLNLNGKVDRQALLALSISEHFIKRTYIQPRTERERELAKIWMEQLSLKRVSIDDNFFELGGHSLSTIQLIFRMRKKFGVDVTLRTLFEMPTIEKIAQFIGR